MGGKVAHKFRHKDQRAGGGFGQTKAVHHLRQGQPAFVLHHGLRHPCQHGISAAKGDNGEFGKEQPNLEQQALLENPKPGQRDQPQATPDREGGQRASGGVMEGGHGGRGCGFGGEGPKQGGGDDDHREGNVQREQAKKRSPGDNPVTTAFQRAF